MHEGALYYIWVGLAFSMKEIICETSFVTCKFGYGSLNYGTDEDARIINPAKLFLYLVLFLFFCLS